MYCKKCGRRIKDGERFCDRCGQSVRAGEKQKASPRHPSRQPYHENSELKRKRKKLEEQKIQREQQKKVSAKRRLFLLITSMIVVIAVGSGVISYQLTKKNSEATWKRTDESVQMNSTATPVVTQTPAVTEAAVAPATTEPATQAPSHEIANQVKLYKDPQSQFSCPYPETFQMQTAEDQKTLLYVTDPAGGGSVRIGLEPNAQNKAADALLKEYAAAAGGTVTFSRAGTNWYTVEVEKNGNLHHRKEYIVNGNLVYYEFAYDMTSPQKADYDEFIAYIDENFKLL
jgi:cytoskeletal protein RodZ